MVEVGRVVWITRLNGGERVESVVDGLRLAEVRCCEVGWCCS